jgi:hypothetical protein
MPLDHARRLAASFPNSRLLEVADSYTLVQDQPTVLAAHLRDFIGALDRTRCPAAGCD